MNKNVKKLLIILGILVIIAIAVVVIPKFQDSAKTQTPLMSKGTLNVNGDTSTPDPSQQFVSLLQSIKTISLDPSIIQSKAFQKLVNYGSVLPTDAPAGRPNPFAPVGQDTASLIDTTNTINTSTNQELGTTNKNTTTLTNQSEKKTTNTTVPTLDSLDSLLNGL